MLLASTYSIMVIDFIKTFYRMRHVSLMAKMAQLNLPDQTYNWFADFFNGHSHWVKFHGDTSSLLEITASINQGSAINPASYVVTAFEISM